jgi:predicted nucleic acid-binding protein
VLRRDGVVTAPPEALDADVLIAVQAIAEGAAVVTANVRHFENVVRAMTWKDVPES